MCFSVCLIYASVFFMGEKASIVYVFFYNYLTVLPRFLCNFMLYEEVSSWSQDQDGEGSVLV